MVDIRKAVEDLLMGLGTVLKTILGAVADSGDFIWYHFRKFFINPWNRLFLVCLILLVLVMSGM